MSYNRGIFIRRNTKPNFGSRQSGSQRARTHGLAKERAIKPIILRLAALEIFRWIDISRLLRLYAVRLSTFPSR